MTDLRTTLIYIDALEEVPATNSPKEYMMTYHFEEDAASTYVTRVSQEAFADAQFPSRFSPCCATASIVVYDFSQIAMLSDMPLMIEKGSIELIAMPYASQLREVTVLSMDRIHSYDDFLVKFAIGNTILHCVISGENIHLKHGAHSALLTMRIVDDRIFGTELIFI